MQRGTQYDHIGDKKKILIIDDNIHYTRILVHILTKENYYCFATLNPQESAEIYTQWQPDLVILNVDLSDKLVSGIKVYLDLKEINKNIPILLLTNDIKREDIHSLEKDSKKIISKPFDIPELIRKIRTVLAASPPSPWLNFRETKKSFTDLKLGEILIEAGLITNEQLRQALSLQSRAPKKVFIGKILIDMGYITEEALAKALSLKRQIPCFVTPFKELIDPEIIERVPKDFAYKMWCIPLFRDGNTLYVGVVNPFNLEAQDIVRNYIPGVTQVVPVVSTKTNISNMLKDIYGPIDVQEEITELEKTISAAEECIVLSEANTVGLTDLTKISADIPIEKLTNTIIFNAIKERASDIHIEPFGERYRIRYRIDGVLLEIMTLMRQIAVKVLSRVKIMAKLNIVEQMIPQDGRTKVMFQGKKIDLRIATLPGLEGEKIVIRILNKDTVILPLEELGFSQETLRLYQNYVFKPQGFILIVGPTGCGKTTTLYSTLSKIGTIEKNIITIEDPVEYQIDRFNQVQINPKRGLTFAAALRAVLRQDPNIILVGEIRDLETAEIAFHAALTGHLVFSTLHTNNSVEAISRLIDMGVEPYILSSALSCVISQRLVRVACKRCKKPYSAPPDILKKYNINPENARLCYPVGCSECRNTGYRGRTGVFEFLPITPVIKEHIQRKSPPDLMYTIATSQGLKTLQEAAIEKVASGITTLEELERVITTFS